MTNKLKIFETTFNKYTVIKNIGEGGSGRVFNVVDEDNNILALKILSPDKITNEKRKRFKNEINFCYKNKHPNIIKVLDFGFYLIDKKNCPFYIMSYYPETLRTLIDKKIDHNKILILLSSILDGIEAAHILNIYHRDLKPENILYNPKNNELVIADFGIAHFNEDYLLTTIETDPRSKLANLRYSSPEQRIKGEIINQKSDIYSLGLIFHEMFTNEVPQGTGYTKIINLNPNYSYLDTIIEKMIQQKQNNRYNSIEEIKKDLIAYKNEFIAFQELEKKKSEVIKKVDIENFEDIKPIGVDYKDNSLIFTLDKEPDPKWIISFKNPEVGYLSYISGFSPNNYQFRKNQVISSSKIYNDNQVQEIANDFKNYIEMANRNYKKLIKNEAIKKENDLKIKLQNEIEEAEKKNRILKNIRL